MGGGNTTLFLIPPLRWKNTPHVFFFSVFFKCDRYITVSSSLSLSAEKSKKVLYEYMPALLSFLIPTSFGLGYESPMAGEWG